jgi:hypothetical protein
LLLQVGAEPMQITITTLFSRASNINLDRWK